MGRRMQADDVTYDDGLALRRGSALIRAMRGPIQRFARPGNELTSSGRWFGLFISGSGDERSLSASCAAQTVGDHCHGRRCRAVILAEPGICTGKSKRPAFRRPSANEPLCRCLTAPRSISIPIVACGWTIARERA